MKVQTLLTGALAISSAVFGAIGLAEPTTAATFVNTEGDIISAPDPVDPSLEILRAWEADEAISDSYHRGKHKHAFWLPNLIGGESDIPGGTFVWEGDAFLYEFTNDTAHLFGSIQALRPGHENKKFDVSVWFNASDPGWGGPKKELKGSAYSSDDPVDTDEWWYYTIDPTRSVLTGVAGSEYDGWTLNLSEYTTKYNSQFGIGASGKNINMGLASWFSYTGSSSSSGHADINIDLKPLTPPDTGTTDDPTEIPEPTMSLLALGLVGFSLRSLKRKTV